MVADYRVCIKIYMYSSHYACDPWSGERYISRGPYTTRTLDIEAHSIESARDKARSKGADIGASYRVCIDSITLAPFGAIDPIINSERPSWAGPQPWQGREMLRLATGEYKLMPWAQESWAPTTETAEHFAHVSNDDPSKLAFTVSVAKGEADKQERIKPGRYLKKFYGDILNECEIQSWAGKFAASNESLKLQFAESADDIESVYINGPTSCMSHEMSDYDSPVYPVRVYGASDIRVAYLKRGDNITARALVYGTIHSRIYGDIPRMESALDAAGFLHGSLDGAKITRIEADGYDNFVLPYIDSESSTDALANASGVNDMGSHLIICDHGHDHCADTTNGLVDDDMTTCENCDSRFNPEDEGSCVGDSQWCDSCIESHAFYCTSCEVVQLDENHAHEGICDDCISDSHSVCDSCGEYHLHEDSHITPDGESQCESCFEDNYFRCDDCGESFGKDEAHKTPDGESQCESCFESNYRITDCGEAIERGDSCDCEECAPYEESVACAADSRQIPLPEHVGV